MEVVDVAKRIEAINNELAERRKWLESFVRSHRIPNALKDYKKAIELTSAKLRADGTPATLVDKLAQGRCAEKEADLEQAKIEYRAACVLMDAAENEKNGWQSIYKRLSEM